MKVRFPAIALVRRELLEKVGGYRDYFDDEQVAFLDKLVDEGLDPVFGYQAGHNSSDERAGVAGS